MIQERQLSTGSGWVALAILIPAALACVAAFVDRTPSARLVPVDDGHELMASLDAIFAEARAFLAPG